MQIRLPLGFTMDHMDRISSHLNIIKKNKKSVYVDHQDPALKELLEDAKFYFSMLGKKHFEPESEKFCIMARTLLDTYNKEMDRILPIA
jgi:hypothetical protein